MKKILAAFLTLVMLLSVCGTVLAESEETNQEPTFERPVSVCVMDETGAPVSGAAMRISDSQGNILKTWDADGEQVFFLKEGAYTIENLAISEDYLEEAEPVEINIARTAEENQAYTGSVTYDHAHEICTDPSHVGLELYTVSDNENTTVAYCFNHGRSNPTGESNYKEYAATPHLLFQYALNKNDDISEEDLYDHVLSIIYRSETVREAYGLDDCEIRYISYIAIKNFTDPKCFYAYDANGNSLLKRDANGRPMRDENGNYIFNPGGSVLGTVIHHARADHGNQEDYVFPQKYINAFNDLIGSTEHPNEYYLYFYYPENYDIENDDSDQILISAKQAEAANVTLTVRPAMRFEITLVLGKSKMNNNCKQYRPSTAEIASKVRLYADGVEVTDQYRNSLEVIDNRDNTYSIRFEKLPKLNEQTVETVYSLKIGRINGYLVSTSVVMNGGTIRLSPITILKDITPIPVNPIKPVKP